MPRQQIERRDNTLLNAVLKIQEDTAEIKTSQAVTTSKLIDVEDHLKTLNSKVATQEARAQELGSTQTLLTAAITSIKEKDDKRTTFWQRNQDKIIWGVIGIVLMLFYYLLTHNGFPEFIK
jgi:hypothetical protein